MLHYSHPQDWVTITVEEGGKVKRRKGQWIVGAKVEVEAEVKIEVEACPNSGTEGG